MSTPEGAQPFPPVVAYTRMVDEISFDHPVITNPTRMMFQTADTIPQQAGRSAQKASADGVLVKHGIHEGNAVVLSELVVDLERDGVQVDGRRCRAQEVAKVTWQVRIRDISVHHVL